MLVKILDKRNIFSLIGIILLYLFGMNWAHPEVLGSATKTYSLVFYVLGVLVGLIQSLRNTYFNQNLYGLFCFLCWLFAFSYFGNDSLKYNLVFLVINLLMGVLIRFPRDVGKTYGLGMGLIFGMLVTVFPLSVLLIPFFIHLSILWRTSIVGNFFLGAFTFFFGWYQLDFLLELKFPFQEYFSQDFYFSFLCTENKFIPIAVLSLILVLAFIHYLNKGSLLSEYDQKVSQVYFYFIFYWLFLFIFIYKNHHQNLLLLSLPFSFVLGKYVESIFSKFWKEVILWLILVCSIAFHFIP
ncbi:MAG: hypothetical protein C4K58_00050 [Flavobacteriaceae bacterium]|nr:MAG: hypothetical protein C4K58_00050 [Flavobacteriaceae bacterium]